MSDQRRPPGVVRQIIHWANASLDEVARARNATGRELVRVRRLMLFTWLILLICVASTPLLLVRQEFLHSLAPTFCGAMALWTMWALRRGQSLERVTLVFVGSGMVVAVIMSVTSGVDGAAVTFWMSVCPLIAMTIGGTRPAFVVLLITLVAVTFSLVSIEYHWFPNLFQGRTIVNRLGSVLGACILAYALMHLYEAETRRSIGELERQNEELLKARAESERANRAKSDFLATVSHEIRTPLNGVTGMATLLEGETDPTRVREGMRVIRQSADVLLAVINDVLDLSKIESNHLELEATAVNLEQELKVVLELLEARAGEQHTALELVRTADVPAWIRGDATRLRQIAMNLISNAVKFTRGGRVLVSLRTDGPHLVLEVTDTGIGISSESLTRLFQPFTQADASTTRKFGGTGLGLVITDRLVQAMGGRMSVTSEPGKGSSFLVHLPLVVIPAPAPLAVVAPQAPAASREVLVVEDNFVNQIVVKRLLEKLGHTVSLAVNGAAAVDLALSRSFDLILMDCHMPVMDGFDATRALREKGCTTPIHALTAAVTTEDLERCTAVGMNGVLSKPLRLERLQEVLDALPRLSQAAG